MRSAPKYPLWWKSPSPLPAFTPQPPSSTLPCSSGHPSVLQGEPSSKNPCVSDHVTLLPQNSPAHSLCSLEIRPNSSMWPKGPTGHTEPHFKLCSFFFHHGRLSFSFQKVLPRRTPPGCPPSPQPLSVSGFHASQKELTQAFLSPKPGHTPYASSQHHLFPGSLNNL